MFVAENPESRSDGHPYLGRHRASSALDFWSFEFRNGQMRYANNSNYKNDTIIRKEAFISPVVLRELKRTGLGNHAVVTIYITEWRTEFRRDMNEKENASSAITTDSLLNYETVKYYGNEVFEVDRFRHAIECFQLAEWRLNVSLALLNFMQNRIIGLEMTAGSVLVVYLITVDQELTVGDYVLFTTCILQLYAPLNFFGTNNPEVIDMENMFGLMNEDVDVRDSPNAIEYQPTEGKISVHNLVFGYNENRTVLNGISFDVASGQSVALEDDANWPEPDKVGRQELQIWMNNEHILLTTGKIGHSPM